MWGDIDNMGLEQLPDELLMSMSEQWPCREREIRQLSALVSPTLPTHPVVVAYGPHATGKSSILQTYLTSQHMKHVFIRCRECVTGRHLLERTAAAVHEAVHGSGNGEAEDGGIRDGADTFTGRCESLSALSVHLQTLLQRQDKLVLVFDGVDKQRDAPPTLLPALARLGEFIPNLTTILIVQHPSPRFLHHTGIPHIHFPPYTRNQSIHILSQSPLPIFLTPPPDQDYDEEVHEEDKAWLWPRYCAAIWDSLAQNAAQNLSAYRDVCHKLWRPFVAPIVRGDFGTRDFSRLLVNQRRLFQDESVLLDSILPATTLASAPRPSHELPYYAKWLLIAAYLSSFTPPRLDAILFMKATEQKRRKKGGGTARGRGRPSQTRKVPRHLLAPSAFTLDRLMAIFHGIIPHDVRGTVDFPIQIATLTSLRLLVRSGGGIGGSNDPLEPGGKWKVGLPVTWEYAQALARGLEFTLIDYVVE